MNNSFEGLLIMHRGKKCNGQYIRKGKIIKKVVRLFHHVHYNPINSVNTVRYVVSYSSLRDLLGYLIFKELTCWKFSAIFKRLKKEI